MSSKLLASVLLGIFLTWIGGMLFGAHLISSSNEKDVTMLRDSILIYKDSVRWLRAQVDFTMEALRTPEKHIIAVDGETVEHILPRKQKLSP